MGISYSFLKKIIPGFVKNEIKELIRNIKSPKMITGYLDYDGEFRPRTRYSDTVFFYHRDRIKIADNVFIWHYAILDGTARLEIGEGTQIGACVSIFTHTSHMAIRLYGEHFLDIPSNKKKGFLIAPVKIGKYVFIASGSKILHGVTIGDGSIIAVNSVVKNDVPPYSIVSGNPAEIVGDIKNHDKRFLRSYPELREFYFDKELMNRSFNIKK